MNTKSLFAPALAIVLGALGGAYLSAPNAVADDRGNRGSNQDSNTEGRGDRDDRRGEALSGTKCWELAPALGKSVFLEMHFAPIRGTDHSMMSGRALRADGGSPDRVLQFSGSASKHSFIGTDEAQISRFLIDANYSMTKTGSSPDSAFAELGRTLEGHYNIRLNPETLNGAFEGHDVILDWTPPLSGPSATSASNAASNPFVPVAGANNYLGSITCDGSVPGFDNCGTVLPVNNSGTLTLLGSNRYTCEQAAPSAE